MISSTGIKIPSPPVPTEEEKHQMTLEAVAGQRKTTVLTG